jgi:hypothetical protein
VRLPYLDRKRVGRQLFMYLVSYSTAIWSGPSFTGLSCENFPKCAHVKVNLVGNVLPSGQTVYFTWRSLHGSRLIRIYSSRIRARPRAETTAAPNISTRLEKAHRMPGGIMMQAQSMLR